MTAEKMNVSQVTFRLTANLARHTGNSKIVSCELKNDSDLLSAIKEIDRRFPGLKAALCTDDSEIADSINLYVNGENVRYLEGLGTSLKHGDIINIVPAAAAG